MCTMRRTSAEMLELDTKIRPLYERGVGCRIIGEVLGENPATVLRRVRRMGIARTPSEANAQTVTDQPVPFTNAPAEQELRRAAVGIAIRWFLERGYTPSLPVEPVKYDLVVDSDEGLQRVQVKSTTSKAQRSDHWFVGIGHKPYDANTQQNAGGKRGKVPYTKKNIDFFFVVTGTRTCYLIPVEVAGSRTSLTLDGRFDRYICGRGGTVDPPASEAGSQ